MSKVLTAADIISANDRKVKEVEVKEWGGKVYLRTISGAERDDFEAETYRQNQPNLKNLRARFLSIALCDEEGKRLFTSQQVGKLGEKSSQVLDRLFLKAAEMNALSNNDIDDLLGNSNGGQSGDSTSG